MREFIYEIYHESSKLSLWDWEQLAQIRHINESGQLGLLAEAPALDLTLLPQTVLPPPLLPDASLRDVLVGRRSAGDLGGGSLMMSELSTLLHFSAGLNGSLEVDGHPKKALRFCPSPGALYPLTVLVEAIGIRDFAAGVYYYDPEQHALGRIEADLSRLAFSTSQGSANLQGACRIWLFCRFDRLSFKYGERSYRFALLEAGHIAQNLLLVATCLSIPARPFAGFLDDSVTEAIDLEGFGLVPLYFVATGGSNRSDRC